MKTLCHTVRILTITLVLLIWDTRTMTAQPAQPSWMNGSTAKLENELVAKYGETQRSRLQRGLRQVATFWRPPDGGATDFEEFVCANFAGDQATLDTMFARFVRLFEQIDGHMDEPRLAFRWQTDLDFGPILPLDAIFAGYDPAAHLNDDFFENKLAFVFQSRDLELLGLAATHAKSEALKTLDDFWGACEIASVALVDMAVWHWMYDHPQATPAQLREATIQISKDIWNKYYAPIFKKREVVLLGIYSHMIHSFLYLPDYPLGHMIARQIEEQMKKAGDIGAEFERMATAGNIAPDLWMKNATGSPVGPEALLSATERALQEIRAGE